MKLGMRWAVEARKRRRDEEQEQSMGQEEDKKAESTDELKMMSRSEEVRTGRGSACLVQRTDEKCPTNEICRKGKGKEEKENTDAREEEETKEQCISRTQ